jgi:hypothetical protein
MGGGRGRTHLGILVPDDDAGLVLVVDVGGMGLGVVDVDNQAVEVFVCIHVTRGRPL